MCSVARLYLHALRLYQESIYDSRGPSYAHTLFSICSGIPIP